MTARWSTDSRFPPAPRKHSWRHNGALVRSTGSRAPLLRAYRSATDSTGRAEVIGSAWRWMSRHSSSSRRKTVVTRSDIELISSAPPSFACVRWISRLYARSAVASSEIVSKPMNAPSRHREGHALASSRPDPSPGEAVPEAAAAVVRPSRIPTAAEASAYLESLPHLWAKTSDAGRHAIAEAVFERIDVLGVTDYTFTLTAHAKARGWMRPSGPATSAWKMVIWSGREG